MGVVNIGGQLQAGPKSIGACQDRSVITTALALKGGAGSKSYNVATGVIQLTVQNNAYQVLPGVGAAPNVTKGDTLYFFAASPIKLRLTNDDGTGMTTDTRVLSVDGLVILEFDQRYSLKLLEALGNADIEFFVSGQS